MIEDEVMLPRSISNTDNIIALEDWCSENIGPRARSRDHVDHEFNWYESSHFGHSVFYFASKEDAVWFRLSFDFPTYR